MSQNSISTKTVKIEQTTSEDIWIGPGVRQGCVSSPLLFNLYSVFVFRETFDDVRGGIKINAATINNIKSADDTVLITNNVQELQNIINSVVRHREMCGFNLNVFKTTIPVFSKTPTNVHLYLPVLRNKK